jgi:hypothetical protein
VRKDHIFRLTRWRFSLRGHLKSETSLSEIRPREPRPKSPVLRLFGLGSRGLISDNEVGKNEEKKKKEEWKKKRTFSEEHENLPFFRWAVQVRTGRTTKTLCSDLLNFSLFEHEGVLLFWISDLRWCDLRHVEGVNRSTSSSKNDLVDSGSILIFLVSLCVVWRCQWSSCFKKKRFSSPSPVNEVFSYGEFRFKRPFSILGSYPPFPIGS